MARQNGPRKKSSTPVRIDPELYSAARTVAPTMSRSTTQQISHWARIGRELEASPRVSVADVVAVLRDRGGYDDLGEEEQAVVRALWREGMEELRDGLRLDLRYSREGRAYAELDADGNVVRREAPAGDGAPNDEDGVAASPSS